MRKSITPNGEILIDTKCYWAVSWNYRGRIENCRPISKGYGMLVVNFFSYQNTEADKSTSQNLLF
jgi:hypothetical protein